MRCPDCNKFAAYDTGGEPEINVEVDDTEDIAKDGKQKATIQGDVRIELTHDECGTALKEATFDVSEDVVIDHDLTSKDGHELSVEDNNGEITQDSRVKKKRSKAEGGGYKMVPGGGRYATTFYGAAVTFTVKCKCGSETEVEWKDETSASSMDELT